MKIAILLLLIATPAIAQNETEPKATEPKTTSAQRDHCNAYLAPVDRGQPGWQMRVLSRNLCMSYTRGVKDEMDGEIQWVDSAHKKVVVGNWQAGVTVDQLVRVFMDYVAKNPSELDKPARDVIRESAEGANIYKYTPAE